MYVEAINDGAVPNITSAWESVVDQEREKYFQKAKFVYVQQAKEIEMPKEESDLLSELFKMRSAALDTLRQGFKLGDEETDKNDQKIAIKELTMFIEKTEKDTKKSNLIISRKTCEEIIRNTFSNINLKKLSLT